MREIMLILHFIGLAMGLGTSFAFMFLGIASSKMDAKEAQKFQMNTFALARMGHIGLTLLIISGGYLMTPYWSILFDSPILLAKLILVVVLAGLIGIVSSSVKKARKSDSEANLEKVKPLGQIALLTGIIIVILAVYFFH